MTPDIIDRQYINGTGTPGTSIARIFRDELLKSYIRFVHPHLPMVDILEFVQTMKAPGAGCRELSPLLFHAVMFAGALFVDMKYIFAAGYFSRKGARDCFFHKAQVREPNFESKRNVI
jgi:hypothetical protein